MPLHVIIQLKVFIDLAVKRIQISNVVFFILCFVCDYDYFTIYLRNTNCT